MFSAVPFPSLVMGVQCVLFGWGRNEASEILQSAGCNRGCRVATQMTALGSLDPSRIR